MRLPPGRIGCTRSNRPTASAASTAAPRPFGTPARRWQQIEELVADGRPPAAFICESVYGNAGGMALPDGYLQQVYAAVRAAGGLAISDEVQVGYGRLGEWFWGFMQQNAVPDIVSVAKSTGNGYPLGAVITSRAVADGFRSQGYFFSSTGGSPLSCAIGMTVLDVLRDEGLQENAARVGAHLKARLQALQDKHPIIGTVHGIGLYLGVEMVRDAETLEPAPEETSAICDRMLELGVVIQPTGDHMNILKTKPPLCIDIEARRLLRRHAGPGADRGLVVRPSVKPPRDFA